MANKSPAPLVVAQKLSKKFGDFAAVKTVSFKTYPKEIFGLLGPNGAGKTTTIRLLATVLSPTSGNATVAGFDIRRQSLDVRRRLGLLTTDIGVYDRFTGRENLEYFGNLYGLAGQTLKERIKRLSNMLEMDDFVDRRAGTYSTGMKQKLAIARSVIHDPEVIIFDEPTSGLDVLAAQTVLQFMKVSQKEGKCVIFSTHHLSDAEKLCHRVAIMHHGEIIAENTVTKIKQQTHTSDLEDAFLKLIK